MLSSSIYPKINNAIAFSQIKFTNFISSTPSNTLMKLKREAVQGYE